MGTFLTRFDIVALWGSRKAARRFMLIVCPAPFADGLDGVDFA
jgi:hypothetical protein